MASQLLIPLLVTLLSYVLLFLTRWLYHEFTSPLRGLPGPKSANWIVGQFFRLNANETVVTARWREEFGPNFLFSTLFNKKELYTSDIKAISHITSNATIYKKGPVSIRLLTVLFGKGILSVEDDEHRKQADTKANGDICGAIHPGTLRDLWFREIKAGKDSKQIGDDKNMARIEVSHWLDRATLDMIGHAGFNYQFDALASNGQQNKLNQAVNQIFDSPNTPRMFAWRIAQAMVPVLRFLPFPGQKAFDSAQATLLETSNQLLLDGKAALEVTGSEKDISSRRDLFSLLLKANMDADLPSTSRLSDAEVVAQIPAFLVAGHATTSIALSWALHELSLNRGCQTRLREELLTVSSDNPTVEELNALPYLQQVVQETMRVHAPVVSVRRTAMENDALPLGTPYTDKNGVIHDSLPIRKGQKICIPLLAVNIDKTLWGEDAAEFKPERWEHLPGAVQAIPGVWSNLMTFFAGHRHCIGFRFSLAEQKAALFTLIRAFEFEPAVPKEDIGSMSAPQRPFVLSEREKGAQMPLIIVRTPYLHYPYPLVSGGKDRLLSHPGRKRRPGLSILLRSQTTYISGNAVRVIAK
ncbi:cytochrome P450 [Mycena rebaudengoi]|nr:cytochrome P450 [Mycena rebaudengoi]